MKTFNTAWMLAATLALSTFAAGCINEDDEPVCAADDVCDSSSLAGPTHGLRDDGTVDITVEEAWPNRSAEPTPLTARELAEACAVLAACYASDEPDPINAASDRDTLFGFCLMPDVSMFWEERAVPTSEINERWTYEARAILASGGDCSAVLAIHSDRPSEIVCEEAGCWWSSSTDPIPDVTCNGDVATLVSHGRTYVRDCSHALQSCDPASPTGCTDRAPTRCTHPAKDRCDGDVRLGCDGRGRVSFHDCTRLEGGTCQDTDDGVRCVYPDAGECELGDSSCAGDVLSVCVLGQMIELDCKAMGLGGCAEHSCGL